MVKKTINNVIFIFYDLINFILSKSSWWFFIILFILMFTITLNDIQNQISIILEFNLYNYFNFNLDKNEVITMLDSRIINISAVFSISFIIIGFVINNIKRYNHILYDLIYEKIKIFPILYFSLSLIGMLIISSSLRNILSSETLLNILLLGTSLIIFDLFIIGYMFIKVIAILKPVYVYNTLYNKLKLMKLQYNCNYKKQDNINKINEFKDELEDIIFNISENGNKKELSYILEIYSNILFYKD